jgi:hypothetical protein
MPPKAPSLKDEIIQGIIENKKGPLGWFGKLPADVQQDILEIRDEHRAGKTEGTKTAVSDSIHRVLKARGLITVTRAEVFRWFNKRED